MTEERLNEIRRFLQEPPEDMTPSGEIDRALAMVADLLEDRGRLTEARNNAIEAREALEKRYVALNLVGQEAMTMVRAMTNLQQLLARVGPRDGVPVERDKVPVAPVAPKEDTQGMPEATGEEEIQDGQAS